MRSSSIRLSTNTESDFTTGCSTEVAAVVVVVAVVAVVTATVEGSELSGDKISLEENNAEISLSGPRTVRPINFPSEGEKKDKEVEIVDSNLTSL